MRLLRLHDYIIIPKIKNNSDITINAVINLQYLSQNHCILLRRPAYGLPCKSYPALISDQVQKSPVKYQTIRFVFIRLPGWSFIDNYYNARGREVWFSAHRRPQRDQTICYKIYKCMYVHIWNFEYEYEI